MNHKLNVMLKIMDEVSNTSVWRLRLDKLGISHTDHMLWDIFIVWQLSHTKKSSSFLLWLMSKLNAQKYGTEAYREPPIS